MIAFLHKKVRDTAERGCADVDVSFGLNLACAADGRHQVFTLYFGGGDGDDVGSTVQHCADNDAGDKKKRKSEEDTLF